MHSTPHLVSDTFPPSQVGPGGGATIHIYIYTQYNTHIYIYTGSSCYQSVVGGQGWKLDLEPHGQRAISKLFRAVIPFPRGKKAQMFQLGITKNEI